MSRKLKLSPSTIYLIVLVIAVYAIWFIFFQDVIQFILENAISTDTGERDPFTGLIGIFFLPFLGVVGILGITTLILLLIKKIKEKNLIN